MAANVSPIFSRLADVQWAITVLAANTTTDLSGGTIYLVWTADATNGGLLQKLKIRQLGTNVATVMRVWINNGSTTATAANNTLYDEITILATTVSQTAALADIERAMNLPLPASYRVYVTLGTAVAAGFDVTGVGGKY